MALNYRTQELWNFIPNNDNPLKNVDRFSTEEDLINQQIKLLEGERTAQLEGRKVRDAQRYIDSYRLANNGANDKLRNRNMNTLKGLGISMDDVRAEYFRRHPTPQMEARDRAGEMLNNAFYSTLGPSPVQTAVQSQAVNSDAQIQKAKKLVVNELKRLNAAGEIYKDINRTKKLIDLYNKLK